MTQNYSMLSLDAHGEKKNREQKIGKINWNDYTVYTSVLIKLQKQKERSIINSVHLFDLMEKKRISKNVKVVNWYFYTYIINDPHGICCVFCFNE